MANLFNPELFRGKRQVYQKLPHSPGICWIWDWSETRKRYLQRQTGFKYYAYKKMNGKQYSKTFEDLQVAKKWRTSSDLFDRHASNKEILFSKVAELFMEHSKGRWKISTLELYQSYMKNLRFFSNMPVSQINSFAVDEWLKVIKRPEYLKEQHSNRLSYEHELTLLKQILTHYREYIDETYVHPCRKRHNQDCIINKEKYSQSKDRAKKKFIPSEDCLRFLSELQSRASVDKSKWLYYHLAEFQLLSGCRVGEVCALSWSDIDLVSGQVQIGKTTQWARFKTRETVVSQSTKSGRSRTVQLPFQLLDSLKLWQQRSERSVGLMFSNNAFKPLAYRSVQYHYNAAFKALGLQWTSSHILRHSFATLWLSLTGGNIQTLQSQLGHSTPKQSLHYAKTTEAVVQSSLKGFEGGLTKVVPLPIEVSELGQAGLNTQCDPELKAKF